MHACTDETIDKVRAASRRMVRELGFMQGTLAATSYPPSAVHALVEIGAAQHMTSAALAGLLQLEKSSVSRMVRKLVDAGELAETGSPADARSKLLALTAKGERTLAAIHAYARRQVRAALVQLSTSRQRAIHEGLEAYAVALETHRQGVPPGAVNNSTVNGTAANHELDTGAESVHISQGYLPGVIGRIVEMHAAFYSRNFGFGQFFESLVAAGVAEFAPRLARPCNGLWVATQAGRTVGSVAIDGEDLGENIAHLRWFIVDDRLRGAGAGRQLLAGALAFCDTQDFSATHLWTFKGLDAARRLYERSGFLLDDERPGQQWGAQVVEQRFVRPRPQQGTGYNTA